MTDDDAAAAQPERIAGWTPLTTRLLLENNSGTAWNYWDASSDIAALRAELNTTLEMLRPAKTTAEAKYESIRAILAASSIYQAVVGESDGDALPLPTLTNQDNSHSNNNNNNNNNNTRGDRSMFLDREMRSQPSFPTRYRHLASWIRAVETTAVYHLQQHIELDLTQTSVQVAEYPGDGVSGYPAHCDARTKHGTIPQRILTVITYLTPSDWCATKDEGALRIHHSGDWYTDIHPYAGRTVIFRSDTVQHAVQPSLRRPRRALTLWLYGKDNCPPSSSGIPKTVVAAKPQLDEPQNAATEHPPPLDCDDSNEFTEATIFVSIAAYRDSETGPTIRDLFAKARCPDRLRVGLVLQIDTRSSSDDLVTIEQQLPRNAPWWNDQVRVLQLDARHSTGPCNARAMAETLYRNETYIMQIDAHMRFRRNWDAYLIEQLSHCPNESILTTYPVGYTLPNNIPNETRGTLLVPWKLDTNGMLRIKGRLLRGSNNNTPVRHNLYAAGFAFGRGPPPVPYDGTLHHLFFGEEASMAVRLFTAGYDTYAPAQTVVYHLWSRAHRPRTSLTPRDPHIAERSRAIVQEQLRYGRHLGFGCDKRTVEAFAQAIGVDFQALTIDPERQQSELLVEGDEVNAAAAAAHSTNELGGVPSALINGFLG